jgi:NADH-quinone oxidoreductase subunit L
LVVHAFFKALLFLGSGSVIHGMEHGHHAIAHGTQEDFDPQDMRTMGGLRHKMKTTFWVYLIGALALAGIFPLGGFWSKDEILAHSYENLFVDFVLLAIAAFVTAVYVGRMMQLVFFGKPRHEAAEHAHESPPLITLPLIVLAILTAFGGLLNLPFLSRVWAEAADNHPAGVWLGMEAWLEHSIESFELSAEGVLDLPHTPIVLSPLVAGISLLLALSGLAVGFYIYRRRPQKATDPDPLQRTPLWWFGVLPLNTLYMNYIVPWFNRFAAWLAYAVDWNFWHDFVHNNLIRDMFVNLAEFLANVIDAQGVDGAVNGAGRVTRSVAGALSRLQTGQVRNYALSIFLGAVALLIYFLYFAG